ncbi:MAG: hypothetical protein PHE67_03960 [Campylobacterales bacterium]|nr:hypothetical protein [Campylobacterales bacterium]
MKAVNSCANTDALSIAYRINELEKSLAAKNKTQNNDTKLAVKEEPSDGLSDNLKRYKQEKRNSKDDMDAEVPLWTLYLMAFLLLPTVIGTFIVIVYMQHRFYKKYADCRPIDLRYRDYFNY